MPDGIGTMYMVDGARRFGLVIEGKMEGRGIWFNRDSKRISGLSWERRIGEWEEGTLTKWVVCI